MSYWKNKKVLVTGGAGFIGSYLSELLAQAGAKLTIADHRSVDLCDPADCEKVCKGQEVVLNLAAKVAGIEYNRFHMAEMFEVNMKLQMNVLHAAAGAGVKRFLQVSTACIYPEDAIVPTPESEGERAAPEPMNEGYGFAKLMGEKLAAYYTREKKIEVVIGRPFNAYGPRDCFDEGTSHVIPAIMKRIMDGDDPVTIWGSGSQSRAFVHARDVARGMMLITEKAPAGRPINIGHDEQVTIKDLFYLICKVMGRHPKPFFDTSKPDGCTRRGADTTLLKRYTGFVPSISLEEGIREMYEAAKKRSRQSQRFSL